MELIEKTDRETFLADSTQLLVRHLSCGDDLCGVMLSGGSTPMPVYERVMASPPETGEGLRVLLSDERVVLYDSPDSNFGNMRPMIEALRVAPHQVLPVETELGPERAAAAYDEKLETFVEKGGRICLGLLGLGTDGHTASLFSIEDAQIDDKWAISVRKEEGPERVSVTSAFIQRCERIVFLVAGPEKREMVDRLLNDPLSIPAGHAVNGMEEVEIWYCPEK